MPSPSLLNFVAGLLAGAGINLVTSAATEDDPSAARRLCLLAVPWIAASVFLAWAAYMAERADRTSDLLITANHSPDERQEIVKATFRTYARWFQLAVSLVVAAIVVAVVLLATLPPGKQSVELPGPSGSPSHSR